MLQAIHNTYEHLNLGKVEKIHDDYVVTEMGIWCHILSQKRLLQIQCEEGTSVNYLPNPCLFVKSSIAKSRPPLCLLLHSKNKDPTPELVSLCSFMVGRGMKISRIDDVNLQPRERLRAFKEASFVLAAHCSSWLTQISLCATGTPFLLMEQEISKTTRDFLQISNLQEAYLPIGFDKDTGLVRVEELLLNCKTFKQLTKDTLREMKNMYTWGKNLFEYPRGTGEQGKSTFPFSFHTDCPSSTLAELSYGPGIFFAFNVRQIFTLKKEAIFFPWICYLTAETINVVDSDAFKVSLITCLGVLVETKEVADKIQKLISPIPVSVLPLPKMAFDLNNWRKERAARVVCMDGISIRSNLNTLHSRVAEVDEPLEEEIIISEDALGWTEIRSHFRNGIPFVCPHHEELPGIVAGYPGFCDAKLDPKSVNRFLTMEKVHSMVQFIERAQTKLFCDDFRATAVFANCKEVRS